MTITSPGGPGGNQIIVGSAASTKRRISIAGRVLRPGTYVLFLSAVDPDGRKSNVLSAKFWVLAAR
ncbi:MAG: hypothetical protein NVS1B9_02540 [Solirubrobacteraceae bacterium]